MLTYSVFLVLRHSQAWRNPCGTLIRFQAWRNPGGTLSRFQVSGNFCRKVKEIENTKVCKIDFQTERERILSERRDIHDFLEKKADHAFQGECAAQTRFSEAQSELDRREWRMRNADIVLYENGMQLQSQRMELYQANQLID